MSVLVVVDGSKPLPMSPCSFVLLFSFLLFSVGAFDGDGNVVVVLVGCGFVRLGLLGLVWFDRGAVGFCLLCEAFDWEEEMRFGMWM